MLFRNNGEAVQVRLDDGPGRYTWKLLYKGETIELIEQVGTSYGFEKVVVTEGKIGKKKVETKQFEPRENLFLENLMSISGVGKKTAKDIIGIFKSEDKLIKAIKHDDELPVRDDIEEKLRRKYG